MSHHIHKDKINNPFSKTQQNFGVLLKGIKAGKSVPRQSVELKTPVSSKNEGFSSHQAFKTKGSKMPTIQVKDEGIMTSNSQI